MSLKGRTALSKVFGSPEYMAWAGRRGNLIDARKLVSEFAGTRRTTCGSRYAQGFQDLCRENPPISPAPPQPLEVLAPVWRRDAVFTTALGNFGEQRKAAWAAGWRTVYANMIHAAYYDNTVEHLPLFRQEGWGIVGWGTYGQDSDPAEDARRAVEQVREHGLIAWKANGEAWAEEQQAWKTGAFLTAWNAAGAPCPLGWSVLSSDTANFARAYDYTTALSAPGADIDLQVYGSDYPDYTVGAALGMLTKTPVPAGRVTMTFSITQDGTGPFSDYVTWPGPRRLWIGEWSRADTYQQMARG